MRLLLIPDAHGREFWIEPCNHIDEFDKVIFLGDYHDPYPHQVSKDKSRHILRDTLVPFVEQHKDKVVCLEGNHDMSYLYRRPVAPRYDNYHRDEIRDLLDRLKTRTAYKVDSYLFTHAGATKEWLELNKLTVDDLLNEEVSIAQLEQVSRFRGGDDLYGSCEWCDVYEFNMLNKPAEYYQIFGHTQQQENPIITDRFACLDCRKAFVLDTSTGELREF